MKSLKIGHYTNSEQGTGITVFLFNQPATGAYYICGSSPASRELNTLALDSNVENLHALVFTGGSAFGLGSIDGVMQYLREQGIGRAMPHGGVVPIVPGAAIYDLAVRSDTFPRAEDAYLACQRAEINNPIAGLIGAGTGASVGKLVPGTLRMEGGVGHATITLENGLIVRAYAVVNAVGDVRDSSGKIVAGACLQNGQLADCFQFLLSGGIPAASNLFNTTLVGVFTNANLSKPQLKRISKMATAGMAHAITPVFTRYDGDIVFCVSLGEHKVSEMIVGCLAVEASRLAILNAVKGSNVIGVINE